MLCLFYVHEILFSFKCRGVVLKKLVPRMVKGDLQYTKKENSFFLFHGKFDIFMFIAQILKKNCEKLYLFFKMMKQASRYLGWNKDLKERLQLFHSNGLIICYWQIKDPTVNPSPFFNLLLKSVIERKRITPEASCKSCKKDVYWWKDHF